MQHKDLSSIFAKNKLHALAAVDEQVSVDAGGRLVTVHVDDVHLGNMQQTQHTKEKQEVHLAASDPDHVSYVRRQAIERQQHSDDVWTTVEFLPQQPAYFTVQRPDVLRVQRLSNVDIESRIRVDKLGVGPALEHPDCRRQRT